MERKLIVTVYGNTADDLEQAALDEGKGFFGAKAILMLDDYEARQSPIDSDHVEYSADITVLNHH